MADLAERKRKAYEEADTNGKKIMSKKLRKFLQLAFSMALDFVPVVGNVKGVIEAVTGRDLITGEKLAWWERGLGLLGPLGKGVNGAANVLHVADEVAGGIAAGVRAADGIADGLGEVGAVSRAATAAHAGEEIAGAAAAIAKGSDVAAEGRHAAEAAAAIGRGDEAVEAAATAARSGQAGELAGSAAQHADQASHLAETAAASAAGLTAGGAALAGTLGGTGRRAAQAGGTAAEEAASHAGKLSETGKSTAAELAANAEKHHPAAVKPQSTCGDPIHAATGHQYIEHTLLTLHGAADWPLKRCTIPDGCRPGHSARPGAMRMPCGWRSNPQRRASPSAGAKAGGIPLSVRRPACTGARTSMSAWTSCTGPKTAIP